MDSVIGQIREKLSKYPEAHVEFDESSITVLPTSSDGFTVRLVVQPCDTGETYSVWYNGSHEEIEDHARSAIKLFAFGLSTGCRLRQYSRAGRAYRWIVEAWSPQRKRWEADWEIVRWLSALAFFWRQPTVRYLQNRLIELDAGDSTRSA